MGNTLKTRLFKEIVESFSPIFNIKDHFDHFFEVSKEFGNYFSKQNKSTVRDSLSRCLADLKGYYSSPARRMKDHSPTTNPPSRTRSLGDLDILYITSYI